MVVVVLFGLRLNGKNGGDFAPFFNYDYMQYKKIEAMNKALSQIGYYAESCTCWYSAVYKIQ